METKFNNDNLAYKSLTEKLKASEEESERLLREAERLRKERDEIRFSANRHSYIKRFCRDHLGRFNIERFQANFGGASTSLHRNSGWYYKLQDEPVDTKFGKMYIALLVSVKSDILDDISAIFQECLIQVDESLEEGKQITKLGLGMWHKWDGECYKEIDDCPLGRREEYSGQDFDKFIKKSFISEYL